MNSMRYVSEHKFGITTIITVSVILALAILAIQITTDNEIKSNNELNCVQLQTKIISGSFFSTKSMEKAVERALGECAFTNNDLRRIK